MTSQIKSMTLPVNPTHTQNPISLQALCTPTDRTGCVKSREGKFQMYRQTEEARFFFSIAGNYKGMSVGVMSIRGV